jgi:AraC family transcriptional regulator
VKSSTRSFYEGAVTRAVAQLRATLDGALDLAALAKAAALAPLHFHHVFRGLTAETPLEMHRRLRLERAARALVTTDVAVTQLGLEAGYEAHEAFTRAFRAAFGVAPTRFRAEAKGNATAWTTENRVWLPALTGIHFSSPATQRPRR